LTDGAALTAIIGGVWVIARQGAMREDAHRLLALTVVSPFNDAIVHYAWTDTIMMAGVVWWLALRRSHRVWAVVLLAVALLVKPTSLVVLVPYFLWSHRARVEMILSAATAVIFSLPFALGVGVSAFLYDVIGVQLHFPPRYEALNLTSFIWQTWNHAVLPAWLPGLPALLAVVWIVWRGRPLDWGDLAVQAVVLTFATFLLAKWAFLNYYFISSVMLLTAVATAGVSFNREEAALPWPVGRTIAGSRAAAPVASPT
jgi:hypothetical protein